MKNYFVIFVLALGVTFSFALPASAAVGWGENELVVGEQESSCRELEFVFARGSGAVRGESAEWREFERTMTIVAERRGKSYRVTDLDYPAISVANLVHLAEAYVSSGRAYAFGRSVEAGRRNLLEYYRETMARCPATRWVFGAYSQGAMVVSRAVKRMKAAQVLYVGLLGDPELALPEGEGLLPSACFGGAYSEYRVYAPDCRTNKGVFGGRNPYEYGELYGKYGLWCNAHDYICGSSRRITDNGGHTKYVAYHEVAWLASRVEERLSGSGGARRRSAGHMPDLSEYDLEAQVILSQAEYHGTSSERIYLDASASWHAVEDTSVQYIWSIDDKLTWSSGGRPWVTPSPLAAGHHTVYVKMEADGRILAEASAQIVIDGGGEEARMEAPVVALSRYGDEVRLTWEEGSAYGLLLRLNGVDLGYVESGRGTIRLVGLDFSQENRLLLAWLDEEFRLGEERAVDLNSLRDEELAPSEGGVDEGVETGAGAGSGEVAEFSVVPERLDERATSESEVQGISGENVLAGTGAGLVARSKTRSDGTGSSSRGGGLRATGSFVGGDEGRRWVLFAAALAAFCPIVWLFWRRRKDRNKEAHEQKYPPKRRIDLEGFAGRRA